MYGAAPYTSVFNKFIISNCAFQQRAVSAYEYGRAAGGGSPVDRGSVSVSEHMNKTEAKCSGGFNMSGSSVSLLIYLFILLCFPSCQTLTDVFTALPVDLISGLGKRAWVVCHSTWTQWEQWKTENVFTTCGCSVTEGRSIWTLNHSSSSLHLHFLTQTLKHLILKLISFMHPQLYPEVS